MDGGLACPLVFLFPELACPCIFWEGPSVLLSSHNPRLLRASWPPSSNRVPSAELSGHGAPHQAASERDRGQCQAQGCRVRRACKAAYQWLKLGGGGASLIPLLFCRRERGLSPAAHSHRHAQQQPREKTPISVDDSSPTRSRCGCGLWLPWFHATLVTFCEREFISGCAMSGF